MKKHWTLWALTAAAALALGVWAADKGEKKVDSKTEARVFEMRTYYAAEGKMADLHARFRDHTCKLFKKHGMDIVGFWSPTDPKLADEKMIYILAYPSKAAADKSWQDFRTDPDWIAAKTASEKNGSLVSKVESVYMNPTDYSPLK